MQHRARDIRHPDQKHRESALLQRDCETRHREHRLMGNEVTKGLQVLSVPIPVVFHRLHLVLRSAGLSEHFRETRAIHRECQRFAQGAVDRAPSFSTLTVFCALHKHTRFQPMSTGFGATFHVQLWISERFRTPELIAG